MAIGDGLCDPITMTDYGDFLYQVGLIDEKDRDYFKSQGDLVVNLIKEKKWHKAFEVSNFINRKFILLNLIIIKYL